MIRRIPVICRYGPRLRLTGDGAYAKDPNGTVTWVYNGKEVTGKGIYVGACARSGTLYLVEVLKRLGYKIGHEMADEDGSVGYHLAVIKPENCFHQVRHPLKQISSMYAHQSWGFIDQAIELWTHGLLGCMQYWLKWNELLEEFCVWRYRIEDIPNVWSEFLTRINHRKNGGEFEPLPDVPKDINKREINVFRMEYKLLTWADLFNENSELARKIRDKSKEYGYSFPPTKGQNETEKAQVAIAV